MDFFTVLMPFGDNAFQDTYAPALFVALTRVFDLFLTSFFDFLRG